MAKDGTVSKITSSSTREIRNIDRDTPSVRLDLKLGKLPKRESLGDPYKRK